MQRGSEYGDASQTGWVDSQTLLDNDPLFGPASGDAYRSVVSIDRGMQSLEVGPGNWKSVKEPVYRSVAAESSYAGTAKYRDVPYEAPHHRAEFERSTWRQGKERPKMGAQKAYAAVVQVDTSAGAVRKPQINPQLVPKWPLSVNAVKMEKKSFDEIWNPLVKLMGALGINDFRDKKEFGELSGTYWGVNEATSFTVNIYQDGDSGEYTLDFLRRTGSPFDFHRVREEVLFALLQRPKSPRLTMRNIPDPETGKNINLEEMIVQEEDLNDWSLALQDSCLELRRDLTSVLARASKHSQGCQLMRKNERIVEEIYKSAFSEDTVCTRYAMVALTNLLKDADLCTRQNLDKIFEVAQSSNLRELHLRCTDAITAVMNCQYSAGLKDRCEDHLTRIGVC